MPVHVEGGHTLSDHVLADVEMLSHHAAPLKEGMEPPSDIEHKEAPVEITDFGF